jgi:hypothetical protein
MKVMKVIEIREDHHADVYAIVRHSEEEQRRSVYVSV